MGSTKSVSSISLRHLSLLACFSAVTLFTMSSAHVIKWTLQPRDPLFGVQGENVTFKWSFNITGDTLYAVHLNRLKNFIPREIISYQPNGLVRIPMIYREKYHVIKRANHPTFLMVDAVESDEAKYCCRASSVKGYDDDSCISLQIQVRPSITVISRNQTWNETDDVTLSCNATGKPPPDVTWSKRGSNMKYSGSLLPLKNISREQDGEYWCTANNTAGNVTALVRVTVNYAPSITPNSSSYNLTEGDDLEMHCDAGGRPRPTVTWTKMSESDIVAYPHKQQTLVIRNVNRTEDGTYKCTATNGIGEHTSATIHVNIFFPPRINGRPGKVTVNETNDLHLFCNATGNPPPWVTWSKVADAAVQLSTDKVLMVQNINKTDSGVYQCRVSNGIGTESLPLWTVTVNYKPTGTRLTSDAQSDSVRVGSSVRFFCITDSVPAAELELRYANLSLGFFSSGMFTLENVSISNQGTYKCVPRNSLGTGLEASLNMTVIVAPSIDYVTQNTTVNETNDVKLFCNATGNPTPKITWTFLEDSIKVKLGEHLSLHQVKRTHAGRYRCTASNHVRNPAWADVELRVNYKPIVKDGPFVVKTWINHETAVNCEAEGSPAPEITWTREGSVTSSNTLLTSVSTLTFSPKEKNDFGILHCTAKNMLGAARRTITVKQLVSPSSPEILEIDVGVDNMEIHWKISSIDPDSPVLSYLVQVKVKDESRQWMNCTQITSRTNSSAMLCVMTKLKSSTQYTVRIASRNVVGYSAFTVKEISTKERKIKTVDEHKGLSRGAVDGIIAALICCCALVVIIVAIAKRRR